MKRGNLLGWAGIAVLAVATAWVVYTSGGSPAAPAPTATVTPHIIIVPVTVTATPTPTTTPTSRAPVILPPPRTPVHTARAAGTDATRPAPTATATQWAAPTVPWAGQALTLHAPDGGGLFRVVQLAEKAQAVNWEYTGTDEVWRSIIGGEGAALNTAVEADVLGHFAEGLPAAGQILTTTVDVSFGWPPNSLMLLLRAATIRYVLEHQPEVLQPGRAYGLGQMRLEASELEMDGDAGREWMVAVTFTSYSIKDWLAFDEGPDGLLHYIPAPWPPFYAGHDPVDFDATHDFTGDGRAEIVIVAHHYMMGHSWADGYIYHWRANGWQLVGTPALPSGPVGWDISSEYLLDDFNGDGRTDFRVTTPNYYGFDCRTDTVITYVWDGVSIVATGSEPPLPETGNCLIYAAEHAGSLAGEARGYERVLTLLEVEDAKPDLLAWVKVQLAMRYAALGSGAEAEALLTAAAQAEGDGGYLDLLRQATAEVGSKPVAVCAWLYDRAQEQREFGTLNTDIDEDLSYGGYPVYYEVSPDKVCPYHMVVDQVLAHMPLPATQSPAVVMEAEGMSLQLFEPMALDNDPEPEYLGVLAGPLWDIVIFDQQGLQWKLFSTGASGSATMVFATMPGQNPGYQDVLVAQDYGPAWVSDEECATGQTWIYAMWLAGSAQGWGVADSKLGCADPALLDLTIPARQAEVLAWLAEPEPAAVPTSPDWMRLVGYTGSAPSGTHLLDYIDLLQADTLERRYPLGTQAAITSLLDYLPRDDANAQLVAVRLLYLRGLGYELAGDDVAAVAAYESVLRAAPGSTWAWLAWARVGPAEGG